MQRFDSTPEAKEFLIGRIVAEAQQTNVQLSQTERDTLYYSVDDWTPEETSEAWSSDDDCDAYEKKIAAMVGGYCSRIRAENPEEFEVWNSAVQKLRGEDHYLLVLIDAAKVRPPWDRVKLVLTALLVVAVSVAFGLWIMPR